MNNDDGGVGHLVLSREPGWVVVHATQIDVEDLVCVGKLMGVID